MDFDITQVGMTKNEGKVYLALLELGPSLAGQISRKTGLHRRNIYDITERLIQKGVVGYIVKNNRKLFEAASPDRLKEILDEKQQSLDEILPKLNELYEQTKEKQETNFFKGSEGLKTIFQDQLTNEVKEVLILGASNSAFEILPFYFKWYDEDRKKIKIKVKIIANKTFDKKPPLSEVRYLPEKYSNPLAINIWGDKVAIILWKKPPLAIVIKNKEIAESYKKYFELIWRASSPK